MTIWRCGWRWPPPGATTSSRWPRTPRLDLRHRRGVHLGGRQPERAGTRRPGSTVPLPNAYAAAPQAGFSPNYAPKPVAIIRRPCRPGTSTGRVHLRTFCSNTGGIALPDGLPAGSVYAAVRATGGVGDRRRSAGGLAEPAAGSGLSAAGAWCPTSSPSPRRWATANPRRRHHHSRDRRECTAPRATSSRPRAAAGVVVVGLTVLDLLEREGLHANALTIGDHLKARIGELATRHPSSAPCTAAACTWAWNWFATVRRWNPRPGDRRDLRTDARTRRDRAAHR